jgi:uncharacterized membrane protein
LTPFWRKIFTLHVMSSCELETLISSLYHYIILTIIFLQPFYTQHFLLFAMVCVQPPHIFWLHWKLSGKYLQLESVGQVNVQEYFYTSNIQEEVTGFWRTLRLCIEQWYTNSGCQVAQVTTFCATVCHINGP